MKVKSNIGFFIVLVMICHISIATSVAAESQISSQPQDAVDAEQKDFLIKSIPETHYSALVVHTKVSIRPVREKNSTGNSNRILEEVHTYRARVLETFRGKSMATIEYEMVTEPGEEAGISTKPEIITLCAGPRGFYWPGTGASFPATKEFVTIARRLGKEAATKIARDFRQCN